MILFVNRLMEVVKSLRRYMLSPDSLLLYPEFMFFGSGTWHFCRIKDALHGYFALGIKNFYVQESFDHINKFLEREFVQEV